MIWGRGVGRAVSWAYGKQRCLCEWGEGHRQGLLPSCPVWGCPRGVCGFSGTGSAGQTVLSLCDSIYEGRSTWVCKSLIHQQDLRDSGRKKTLLFSRESCVRRGSQSGARHSGRSPRPQDWSERAQRTQGRLSHSIPCPHPNPGRPCGGHWCVCAASPPGGAPRRAVCAGGWPPVLMFLLVGVWENPCK